MRLCASCGKSASGHQSCAVCFSSNATTRLCDHCRKDPLNAGWGETWEQFGAEDDLSVTLTTVDRTLAEVQDKRYTPSPLESRVLAMLMGRETERVYRYDVKGRRRGSYERPYPSTRAIAKAARCSQALVARIRMKWKIF